MVWNKLALLQDLVPMIRQVTRHGRSSTFTTSLRLLPDTVDYTMRGVRQWNACVQALAGQIAKSFHYSSKDIRLDLLPKFSVFSVFSLSFIPSPVSG